MAISGITSYSITTDDIITEVLEQLGVLAAGETATDADKVSIKRTLNMIIKAMQADGLNLFAVGTSYLFLDKGQASYTLNSTTTDHFTSTFYSTTTSAAASSTDTTIVVTDASNITIGDYISVVSGTDSFWTTVSNVVGSTVTLASGLPFDLASGSIVRNYTTKASRPMKILEAYLKQPGSGTDIPLSQISRREYGQLSSKTAQGYPTQFYYDPQIDGGKLALWATGSNEADYISLVHQRTLSDMIDDDDNPEFPQEWFWPLVTQTAVAVAPKFGTPGDVYRMLVLQAEKWYEKATGFDQELYTSVYFEVDRFGREV